MAEGKAVLCVSCWQKAMVMRTDKKSRPYLTCLGCGAHFFCGRLGDAFISNYLRMVNLVYSFLGEEGLRVQCAEALADQIKIESGSFSQQRTAVGAAPAAQPVEVHADVSAA